MGKDKDKPYKGVITIIEAEPSKKGLKSGYYKAKTMWINAIVLKYGNIDFSKNDLHAKYKKHK